MNVKPLRLPQSILHFGQVVGRRVQQGPLCLDSERQKIAAIRGLGLIGFLGGVMLGDLK